MPEKESSLRRKSPDSLSEGEDYDANIESDDSSHLENNNSIQNYHSKNKAPIPIQGYHWEESEEPAR